MSLLGRLRALLRRRDPGVPPAAYPPVPGREVPGVPDVPAFVPPALAPPAAMHAAVFRPVVTGRGVPSGAFRPACGAEDWVLLSVEAARVTCRPCLEALRAARVRRVSGRR